MQYLKICGLKDPLHVRLCAEYGADAVGFIYNVPSSPRNLEKEELLNLLREISRNIFTVIIFKPSDIGEIAKTMNEIDANFYQVHCDFNIRELDRLPNKMRTKLIVAVKINQDNKESVIREIIHSFNQFYAFLLDNSEGHGSDLNFDLILEVIRRTYGSKIIIAGGIDINNIEFLIKNLKPFGIDVSSSLESEKGVKDPIKIVKFLDKIQEVKESLQK